MSQAPVVMGVYQGRTLPLKEIYRLKEIDALQSRQLDRRRTRDERIGGYRNGYTYEEIKDLYKNFAGQENELRMLMDFTGLGRLAAEDLLGRLKYERSKTV